MLIDISIEDGVMVQMSAHIFSQRDTCGLTYVDHECTPCAFKASLLVHQLPPTVQRRAH